MCVWTAELHFVSNLYCVYKIIKGEMKLAQDDLLTNR